MSAAGRAAQRGLSHILLEKTDHLSDTIYKYQKGKVVFDEPNILQLRSDYSFAYGIREDILGTWDSETESLGVNVRFNADVTAIAKSGDRFELTINKSQTITADYVILCIGLQGNLRQLEVPGAAEANFIQYQLDDPDEYEAENIVVVGAGDAAIENAVALAKHNTVVIVNRRDEFARAKQGNVAAITEAIENPSVALSCLYSAAPAKVSPDSITMTTPDGEVDVKCDRVIARLGAIAPRKFVEDCGIEFPSKDASALPEVSGTYESNVPGLFIIGALGGYPLIKQAMNQGYEVIEFIEGNMIEPADEPLLKEALAPLGSMSVDDGLRLIRENLPVFRELNPLLLRELMLSATVHRPTQGDVIFERNDYTNTFYSIIEGEVAVEVNPEDPSETVALRQGEFFGEMGLIAGRRRTATVRAGKNCILLEVPRRTMIPLINSIESVKRAIDGAAIARQIITYMAPDLTPQDLEQVVATAKVKTFKQDDVIFQQGDAGDSVHLIRRGSVTASQRIAGREVVLSYTPAGHYIGEMAMLSDQPRAATVKAAVTTETVEMDSGVLKELLAAHPTVKSGLEEKFRDRLVQSEAMERSKNAGGIIQFLVQQGVGEATDVLLIDEALCVRCDNCEKACAETHGGINRLHREAGPTFANVHVPTSCRHCEHPHCMTNCPPDAIHRAQDGEVFIDDSCIGCGNCVRDCPYDVIHLAAQPPKKPGLLSWLLFGAGPGPGEHKELMKDLPEGTVKKAVKCDLCKDIKKNPDDEVSCVMACPTGAAIRVSPAEFMSLASLARR